MILDDFRMNWSFLGIYSGLTIRYHPIVWIVRFHKRICFCLGSSHQNRHTGPQPIWVWPHGGFDACLDRDQCQDLSCCYLLYPNWVAVLSKFLVVVVLVVPHYLYILISCCFLANFWEPQRVQLLPPYHPRSWRCHGRSSGGTRPPLTGGARGITSAIFAGAWNLPATVWPISNNLHFFADMYIYIIYIYIIYIYIHNIYI